MKMLAFAQSGSMRGGANRSFLMVLEHLRSQYGHEIDVITPSRGALNDALDQKGIPNFIVSYHEIGCVNSLSPINIFRWLRFHLYSQKDKNAAKKLSKRLQEKKYDLVYINDTDIYFGAYVAQHLCVPYVWHFRSFVNPQAHFILGAKRMYERCARIIAISHGMEKLLLENPIMPTRKISVIHNGIPISTSPLVSNRSRAEGLHMVQCGRISEEKGHRDALRALAILKNEGKKDIFLHIVGSTAGRNSNTYFNELKEFVAANELSKQVIFEGTRDDMHVFRTSMHVELMCSVSEPFGRVTLEGMRSGLAVIGSDTGGTPEIICDGETGLLYRQGDANDLADKIRTVYEDEAYTKNLSAQAFNFSLSHFTPEQNVSAIERVLYSALR